jgi:beta-lactam-binding protein with PASTA domain
MTRHLRFASLSSVLLLATVLAACSGGNTTLSGTSPAGEAVAVPNVVGDTQAAATTAITAADLALGAVTMMASATVASGEVISESPVAGTSVVAGSTVNLTVSSGAGDVTVPNVVGDTQAAATTAITTASLTVGTVTMASSATVPAGDVISQTPAAGASVAAGSAVNLTVSSGTAMDTVPNVVGDTQAAATTAITAAGLSVGTVTMASSATVASGDVISETPAAGASVAAGSAVNLTVSSGAAMDTVPNVVGDTQAAATTAIGAAGLTVGTVTTTSSATVASGSVISESPVAGTSVAAGSAVNLTVSSGATLTGAIYVTNSVTNSVLVFAPNPSGTLNEAPIATIAGSNTGLQNPQGIAIDASGRIYVANDVPNSGVQGGDPGILIAGGYITVYAANPHGVLNEAPIATLTPAVSSQASQLPGFPAAVAIDASGMIYLATGDFGAGGGGAVSVYAADPSGSFTGTPLGTVNTVSFSFTGVAVDAATNIYAANPYAGTDAPPSITVYANPNGTVTGSPLATITGSNTGLNAPFGVALDANGKIYVANISQNSMPSITVYPATPSGTLNEAPIATIAGTDTGLNAPTSVAVDANGLIYVGNGGGSVTVYDANPDGTLNETPIATITGSNTGLSTADAPLFTQPVLGIAVH